jgi:hypothetical protein
MNTFSLVVEHIESFSKQNFERVLKTFFNLSIFVMLGLSNSLHGLANMGVNASTNQQLLKSLVDLIEINETIVSQMNDQEITNTIYSYVYNDFITNKIMLFFWIVCIFAVFLYILYYEILLD